MGSTPTIGTMYNIYVPFAEVTIERFEESTDMCRRSAPHERDASSSVWPMVFEDFEYEGSFEAVYYESIKPA